NFQILNGGGTTPGTATITGPGGPTAIVYWIGGSGNWDDPSHWSDGIPPTMISTVEVLAPVTVTVNDFHTANGLVIGFGANLNMTAGGALEFDHWIQGGGTVTLDSTNGDPTLAVYGAVTLSGQGTLKLVGTAADNNIIGVAGTNAFLINIDDTI